jgi:hypothetical protein
VNNILKNDENIDTFIREFEAIWVKDIKDVKTPTEMCILYYYRDQYYDRYNFNNSENIKFLNEVIHRFCYKNNIDSSKIFAVSSASGNVKPQVFDKRINRDNIPKIFENEYINMFQQVKEIIMEIRKQDREYKNKTKDLGYFTWSNKI